MSEQIILCNPSHYSNVYSNDLEYSLGYHRKMTYISYTGSPSCYEVEEKGGYYYYPYLSLSGFCVRINDEGVDILVRGRVHEEHKFHYESDYFRFFLQLGNHYEAYNCFDCSTGKLDIYSRRYSYNWDCSHAHGVDELYALGLYNIDHLSEYNVHHTITQEASILDVCVYMLKHHNAPYFVFDFGSKGQVAFTREEVKRYKMVGHL